MMDATKQSDAENISVPLSSGAPGDPANLQELSGLIQSVLQQTQDRFQTMSDQVVKRIDEMSRRIDDMEQNINQLMTEAGVQPDDANIKPNLSSPDH